MKSLNCQDSLLFHPPELGSVLFLPGLPGGGSRIYDRSPYGKIVTVIGAVWKLTAGGVPYLAFDGVDDYLSLTNAPQLQITGDLTLKTWVKSSNYTVRNALFRKDYNKEYFLCLYASGNPNGRVTFSHGNGSSSETPIDITGVLPVVNTWFHIVLTRDASTRVCSLYVNGNLKQTSAVYSLTPVASGFDILLGRYSNEFMPGNMTLIEMHCRTWQALEVQNSFNREKNIFGVW